MASTPEAHEEGDLVVWHIPQMPGKEFRVPVASIVEGVKLCSILADYDLFQYDNHIKPDYCNVNGIDRWEDGEWVSVGCEGGADIEETTP